MTAESNQIIDLYRRHAHAWTQIRSQSLFEKKWLGAFMGLLGDTPSVLDMGCGFGEPIGRYLLDNDIAVTGVDTSPELIKIAKERAPQATWIISDMRTLDMRTKFNGIIAWNSTFHLTPDDQRRMFPIFKRHAAHGAALMFTSGYSQGEVIGEFEGEPLYHASLDPSEYRALLEQHGFEVIDHVVEDPECRGHTVWLAQLRDTV